MGNLNGKQQHTYINLNTGTHTRALPWACGACHGGREDWRCQVCFFYFVLCTILTYYRMITVLPWEIWNTRHMHNHTHPLAAKVDSGTLRRRCGVIPSGGVVCREGPCSEPLELDSLAVGSAKTDRRLKIGD